ncbi:MAG TPA: type VI secretion system contractile sheath large subunit, partial [Pirellulales bacterium]|nr:type VI secretion system contractile sheath large subunit [Pirellulales bacterium]
MPYESTFGELAMEGANRAPGGPDTPFRIAVLADFSGRQGREPAASADEVATRKPIKVNHDSLDEAIESVGPKLEYSVAGGDVAVSLEFTEFDDFLPDPVIRQVDRVTDLDDDDATTLLREILHHPQYQALESAWRGLEWLLRRVQKADNIKVMLFDVTAEELAADLMAGDDLSQTALYRQLIATTAEGLDGQPWTAIVGNYTFEETTEHAELLGRMAKIAARAGAPFLAAITSRAAQEGYELPADGKPAWQALRGIPEASYLGISVPGFLLRPPFGESYRPADAFRFEEFNGTPEGYLWGNPGFASAGALALGYMKSGWGFKPSGTLALDNMPMHSYRDADGEAVAVCAEVRFTSSTSQELGGRGFMPLLAVRGRDSVELASIRSLHLENPTLSGRWQGGQGGPPLTRGVPKVSVGMMSKGEGSGRAPPRRNGAEFVSAQTEEAASEAAA